MGQSLSEPKTEKKTDRFENRLFSVGSSCMQGWRLGTGICICVLMCAWNPFLHAWSAVKPTSSNALENFMKYTWTLRYKGIAIKHVHRLYPTALVKGLLWHQQYTRVRSQKLNEDVFQAMCMYVDCEHISQPKLNWWRWMLFDGNVLHDYTLHVYARSCPNKLLLILILA